MKKRRTNEVQSKFYGLLRIPALPKKNPDGSQLGPIEQLKQRGPWLFRDVSGKYIYIYLLHNIRDEIIPRYMGVIINHDFKDGY